MALKLARDPIVLASIKEKLAHSRDTYPLFNAQRTTLHIEAAYRTMWERYERGEPPASFAVEPIACPNRSGLVILSTTGSTRSTLTYEIGSKI